MADELDTGAPQPEAQGADDSALDSTPQDGQQPAPAPAATPKPLFDMSKARPAGGQPTQAPQQGKPLFDMSKARPANAPTAPQTPQGDQPGFLQRAYETGPVKGIVDAAKHIVQTPVDTIQSMLDSVRNGDTKGALQNANKIITLLQPSNPDHPMVKLAYNTIVGLKDQAVAAGKAKVEQYKQDRKNGHGVITSAGDAFTPLGTEYRSTKAGVERMMSGKDETLSQKAGTALDMAGGTMQGNIVHTIAGDAMDKGVEDLHNNNVSGALGDAAGAAQQVGALFLGPSEKGVQAAEDASKVVKPSSLTRAAKTVEEMSDTAQHAPTRASVDNMLADATHDAFSNETGTLQNNLDDATSTIQMAGEGAPQQSQITESAKKFAKARKQTLSANYQDGLDQLNEMADGATIPYEGSPLHQAATELVGQGATDAGPLDQALNVTRPGSPKLNTIIDNLTSVGKEAEGEEAAAAEKWVDHNGVEHTVEPEVTGPEEGSAPPEIGMDHLVQYRQKIQRLLSSVPKNTEHTLDDVAGYRKLLEGVDETIGKLSDSVGEAGEDGATSGRALFDKMNSDYKNGIQPFANKDVKNIMTGNLNNVGKAIMGGQTSIDDIAAVKKALGNQNFNKVSSATLQNIIKDHVDELGNLDYKKLFKSFNRINPDVRAAMFGEQGKSLSDALRVANESSNGLDEIGTTVKSILGGSKDVTSSILADPERAQALARAVGPDGMKTLGNAIVENKIAEASSVLDKKTGEFVKSRFNADHVLDWWMGMKDNPEVRDAFFTVDKESSARYNQMMSDLANTSSVKKLVKYGVLPVTMGTVGAVHGPAAALIAALAGIGGDVASTKFGRAADVLDSIANHPRTWRTLAWVGDKVDKTKAAASGAKAVVKAATPAVKAGAKTATKAGAAYQAVSGVLGDQKKK